MPQIHYNTQVVYAMLVLTHKEYDKEKWKVQLCSYVDEGETSPQG